MMRIYDNGIYRDATPEEVKEFEAMSHNPQAEIDSLKAELAASDYKAIKYAEGWLTDEEYAPIKAERQALRDRINQLEQELYGEI